MCLWPRSLVSMVYTLVLLLYVHAATANVSEETIPIDQIIFPYHSYSVLNVYLKFPKIQTMRSGDTVFTHGRVQLLRRGGRWMVLDGNYYVLAAHALGCQYINAQILDESLSQDLLRPYFSDLSRTPYSQGGQFGASKSNDAFFNAAEMFVQGQSDIFRFYLTATKMGFSTDQTLTASQHSQSCRLVNRHGGLPPIWMKREGHVPPSVETLIARLIDADRIMDQHRTFFDTAKRVAATDSHILGYASPVDQAVDLRRYFLGQDFKHPVSSTIYPDNYRSLAGSAHRSTYRAMRDVAGQNASDSTRSNLRAHALKSIDFIILFPECDDE